MVSLPSGYREDVELVKVEAESFSLVIKGKPYHPRYEGLKQYRKMNFHDIMEFSVKGENIKSVEVYDIDTGELTESLEVRPIFFENGTYQVIAVPKDNHELNFYHEHSLLRQAVTTVELAGMPVLMGTLQFQNEVGYSMFQIQSAGHVLVEIMLEIFPVKLDYQTDYRKLLEEVNEEIYNLAFHFIRKTYLGASIKLDGKPSWSEFYRLIKRHFDQFIQAIGRIEKQPHHELETTYMKVRGDQLSKVDTHTRKHLQKHGHLFVEVEHGIPLFGKQMMPKSGIKPKNELRYDTMENRYVKWMMSRLIDKLDHLVRLLINSDKRFNGKLDLNLLSQLDGMKRQLNLRRKNPFWRSVGRLDRSVISLVLQMAPGYRDAFQIYLTVSKGLMLQGKIYEMSVKDVATLYEYWTFLKLGQILSRKYTLLTQDIVKANRDGLFVNLEANQSAKRVFEHPITKEKITLAYQKFERDLPTVRQMPDSMLSIEKKGKAHVYNYVFDAKYRIDYAQPDSYYGKRYKTPGPLEDDINTMHRYRDSIVAREDGPYERTSFGAYVLFPWSNEESYKDHHFYQSINQVNIGGLPFLPNATEMVEQFIEHLIEKSPEEIQREGILPRGTEAEWESALEDKVLVGKIAEKGLYLECIQKRQLRIPVKYLKSGWQQAKYAAIYTTIDVGGSGIREYGEIEQVSMDEDTVLFCVNAWKRTKHNILPVKYGIATYMMTTLSLLEGAKELPELYMKNKQETTLWKMLRRISDRIQVDLNEKLIDEATEVETFSFHRIQIKLSHDENMMEIDNGFDTLKMRKELLISQPSMVFREVLRMVEND